MKISRYSSKLLVLLQYEYSYTFFFSFLIPLSTQLMALQKGNTLEDATVQYNKEHQQGKRSRSAV